MRLQNSERRSDRREFLQRAGALALGTIIYCASGAADSPPTGAKPFWGVFPIAQTPFDPADKLDLDCLQAEVNFCNRGRVNHVRARKDGRRGGHFGRWQRR